MELASKKVSVLASDRAVFDMLINCNNIKKYIPNDKVKDWQSTESTCSFYVEGAGKMEMSIQKKTPCSSVIYSIGNNLAKGAIICFSINKIDSGQENICELGAKTSLEVPFFMAKMLESTLQKFIDMLIDYIKIAVEKH